MKPTLIKTMAGAFVGVLILIGSRTSFVSAQEPNNSTALSTRTFSKRSIEGVWLTVVQLRNCQSGVSLGPAGRGLLTFAEGGTINETTAPGGPLPAPIFRSPGHGVWERHSWSHYTATIITQRLNPDGSFAGWSKVVSTFQLSENGNAFTASASFEIIDPNGNVISTGCSTSTGTRLQ